MLNNKNKQSNKKILAFMNAYTSGKGGGDVIFLELCQYFNQYAEITVVTSKLAYNIATGLNIAWELKPLSLLSTQKT